MTDRNQNKPIKIAAIGDLLLTAKPGSTEPQRGLEALSPEIREIFTTADIVIANLECTIPSEDKVATEPRVFCSEEQIRSLRNSGINLVTLGNNHCFDGKNKGFNHLTALLDELEIPFFGAGRNLVEAEAPAYFEINGISIAFLAIVDQSSGMHKYASQNSSGVARLETERLSTQIKELSKHVDHVIISPHWGDERFRLPSPSQVQQAKTFIEAGASLILGHHPHVLQGMTQYDNAPVIYSLGNFSANNVYWDNGDYLTWDRFERTGCILIASLSAQDIQHTQQIPIYDDGNTIKIERQGWGERYINRANRMLDRVSEKQYRREKYRVRTLLPLSNYLRWQKIKQIRPAHFRKALNLLLSKTN